MGKDKLLFKLGKLNLEHLKTLDIYQVGYKSPK